MNQIRRPLVVALLSFLAGLLPALRFAPDPLLTLLVLSVVTLALVFGCLRPEPVFQAFRQTLIWPLLVCVGGVTGALAAADAGADCRALLEDGQPLVARGTLGAAHRTATGLERAPLLPLYAELGVPGGDRGLCSGEIRIRIPPGSPEFQVGETLVASGGWRAFVDPVNLSAWPEDPAYQGFLLAAEVARDSSRAFLPPLWLDLRHRTVARIERVFPGQTALVEALLLGRREYVDPEVLDRYTRSGLTHLLAISGSHVALIAGALLLLGSALRMPRRRAVLATIVMTWLYLLVIGAPPSAVRSGMMITLTLLAVLLQRPAATSAIVAAAALAILAFSPLAILDPGFQLSFLGVLGIVYLREPLLSMTPDEWQRRGLVRGLVDAFVMGIGAFLITAPVVAHHFGVIAPISIIAGVPAIPLTSLALIGVALALALDPLLPGVATLIAGGADVALRMLDGIAGLAAAVPYGNGPVARPPWWSWSFAVCAGLIGARLVRRGSVRVRWLVATGATIATLIAWPAVATFRGPDGLEIHFIDVGQGDAVAIRTPADRWVLVDAGPASTDFDAGERRVLPFLRARGARRIEAFVLTHPDLDHIGGAQAIFESLPVVHVFEPGHVVGKESYLDFLRTVDLHRTRWRAVRAGRTMQLDGVRFDFLWPDPDAVDAFADANQISAVMQLTFGDFTLLLTGDAGTDVERLLVLRHGDDLRSDVLKLGHHGSDTSTDPEFLDHVRPDLAIVSAGRRNRYGHPAAAVMDRVFARGIPVARTDLESTISIRVSKDGRDWGRQR